MLDRTALKVSMTVSMHLVWRLGLVRLVLDNTSRGVRVRARVRARVGEDYFL